MTTELYFLFFFLLFIGCFLFFYFGMREFLKRDEKLRILDLKKSEEQVTIPIRLQAYERIALFLERIHPNQLVVRMKAQQGISSHQYIEILKNSIQEEYEHNLSQQIYISTLLWSNVTAAKNQVILELSRLSRSVSPQSSSLELIQKLQFVFNEESEEYIDWAIPEVLESLKKEVSKRFV